MSRAYCYKCHRAEKTCLCNRISLINNDINVYILQHSDEVKNAKGTAIIANLYLKNCTVWKAENAEHNRALNKLIEKQANSTYIVYPDNKSIQLIDWVERINCQNNKLASGKYNLIFIDASWRKAKKIWHSQSVFNKIDCIRLAQNQISNYRIRKIPEPGYLSTIEAIVACLTTAEKNSKKYQPLLNLFDNMIDGQIESMGKRVFYENYQKN